MDREGALRAATSAKYEDRVAAAEALANYDDPRSAATLAELLLDVHDTAVTFAAAAALLARQTRSATELFADAFRDADDTRGDHFCDALRNVRQFHPSTFEHLVALAEDGHTGARDALDWLQSQASGSAAMRVP